VLPPRNAVGRDRFSLATLASASPHGVGPLSEDITPSTQPVRVRKFACANVLFLMSPEIVHGSYRVIRSAGAIDRFWPFAKLSLSGEDTRFCSLGMRSSSKAVCVLAGSGTRVWGARRIGRTF